MPQFKLKPQFKAMWLEALESGRYKQGRRSLRGRAFNEWCCLGVACDLIIQHNLLPGAKWTRASVDGGRCFATDGKSMSEALPPASFLPVMFDIPPGALQHMDFVTTASIFRVEPNDYTRHDTLYHANDAGVPFTQIAQIIREQF